MFATLILFAQLEEKKPADGIMGLLGSNPILPILGIMMLFFFLIILPAQRKQRKEQETLMSGLKKNDEVVTSGGIIGVVANINDAGDQVTLKVDDNTRIRVLKSSIARILKKDEPKDAAAATTPANTNIKPT